MNRQQMKSLKPHGNQLEMTKNLPPAMQVMVLLDADIREPLFQYLEIHNQTLKLTYVPEERVSAVCRGLYQAFN